jgi:hypothetical protein
MCQCGHREKVGVYVLDKDTDFTDRSFETASWWRQVHVKAGEYPVYLVHWYGEQYYFLAELEGVETDQYFPSSYGGVPYTNGKRPEDNGAWHYYHLRYAGYVLAGSFLEVKCSTGGNLYEKPPVKLSAEWEARFHHFEYDGQKRTTTLMVNTRTGKTYG